MFGNHIAHLVAVADDAKIMVFAKTTVGTLAAVPITDGQYVVVERNVIHVFAGIFEQHLSPVVVKIVAAGCHAHGVSVIVVEVGVARILAEHVGVIFGTHIAAAAPRFVADAHEVYFVGFFTTVLLAEVYIGTIVCAGDVFEPIGHIAYRTSSHIHREIGLAAETFAEREKFVCAKRIVLHCAAPEYVFDFGTLVGGANAVSPVVGVGKTAAWPSEYGDLEVFQCVEYVGAVAVGVGDVAVLANPDAVIDAASEVLGKLTVDFGRDLELFLSVGQEFCLSRR